MSLATNPVEPLLRTDRMPHIWCPGCGIGTTVNCFSRALIESPCNGVEVGLGSVVDHGDIDHDRPRTDAAKLTLAGLGDDARY